MASLDHSELTRTCWFTATTLSSSPTSPGHTTIQHVSTDTGVGGSAHEGGNGCINHSIGRVSEGTTITASVYGIISKQESALHI